VDPVLKEAPSRKILPWIGLAVAFTLGLMGGIQYERFRKMEDSVVRRPDQAQKAPEVEHETESNENQSFSNVSLDGRYLIKVGTYSSEKAESTARALNNVPELASIAPVACNRVPETKPGRYPAFRLKADGGKENVFVGCFNSRQEASDALKIVVDSKVKGVSRSQIFEIE
jgi:hypothetical protein